MFKGSKQITKDFQRKRWIEDNSEKGEGKGTVYINVEMHRKGERASKDPAQSARHGVYVRDSRVVSSHFTSLC